MKELQEFIKARPAIDQKRFSEDIGIHHNTMYNVVAGKGYSPETKEKILKGMKKYGFNPCESDS